MPIPARVVLASSDLNAQARVLAQAGDREVVITGPLHFREHLEGASILILDLDEGGLGALAELSLARTEGSVPADVLGFLSHVDRDLGQAAREAGCRAVSRGRFWAHLAEELESL